jgi:hypothetical protein
VEKERAILIHSYLPDLKEAERPDRLSRTSLLAAAELYRRDETDTLCITVQSVLSNLLVERLGMLLYNSLKDNLVVKSEAISTVEEIRSFKRLAEENNWSDLLFLGHSEHLPRVKREVQRIFKHSEKKVEVKSVEGILSRFPRYQGILADMENWPEKQYVKWQEKRTNFVSQIPFLGRIAMTVFPQIMPEAKMAFQRWLHRQWKKGTARSKT